jgi:hypothetical protein
MKGEILNLGTLEDKNLFYDDKSREMRMRSSQIVRASDSQCQSHATVLGFIPASYDTVESEGRHMRQN